MSANSEFKLVPANEVLSQQQIKIDTGSYLKLLPHLHGTDGFFAAVFERIDLSKSLSETKAKDIEAKLTEPEGSIHAVAGASKLSAVKPKAVKPKTVKLEADKTKTVKSATIKPKAIKPTVVKPTVVKPKTVKPKTTKE